MRSREQSPEVSPRKKKSKKKSVRRGGNNKPTIVSAFPDRLVRPYPRDDDPPEQDLKIQGH